VTPTGGSLVVDWEHWQPGIRATLLFLVDEERREVLLIRKKRGLGAGKINGPGGKIDPGETAAECAIRETHEELGITVTDPVKHGELWFEFVDGLKMHVAVFLGTRHEGEPIETDEAIPLWTSLDALPLEEMWADDRFWLHELLVGRKHFRGCFTFDDDTMLGSRMEWTDVGWLDRR
jgi:8-oxo-dGTP diphosphatase